MSTASTPYLWHLMKHDDFLLNGASRGKGMGNTGMHAPTLINRSWYMPGKHVGGGQRDKANWSNLQLINAVHDFDWTLTPRHSRREVPYIRMSEQAVNFNTVRQQLRYMLSIDTTVTNIANDITRAIKEGVAGVIDKIYEDKPDTGGTKGKAPGASDLTEDDIPKLRSNNNVPNHLKSYYGLYGIVPTGFEYVFPYFNETSKKHDNTFTTVENTTLGGGVKDLIQGIIGPEGMFGQLTDIAGFQADTLGTYIERPQLYDSPEEGTSYSFGFDLFNTTSTDSIIRNWHLVFMLMYQNLAHRLSRIAVDPPVIYEVEVPGVFYSPFCYISSINIANRGATRTMEIPYSTDFKQSDKGSLNAGIMGKKTWHKFRDIQRRVKNGSYPDYGDEFSVYTRQPAIKQQGNNGWEIAKRFAEVTIPDAYRVEITLQSLIPESKNTYFHSLLNTGTRSTGLYSVHFQQQGKQGTEGHGGVHDPPAQLSVEEDYLQNGPSARNNYGNFLAEDGDLYMDGGP